jgi:hypothetical protein
MRFASVRWLLAAGLSLGFPTVAHAGPVEQMVQAAMHPTDPNVMAVRYINGGGGVFITRDGGKNWGLVCGAVLFGSIRTQGGPFAISSDGVTSMGLFGGLLHDDGHGCSWTTESKYDGQFIHSVVLDPTDPSITYAVTSLNGQQNGLLKRDATGAWSDLGRKDSSLLSDLQVVPYGKGLRFYVNAVNYPTLPDGGLGAATYSIRVSDDLGATWRDHPYTIDSQTETLFIEAVDPTNPDRLVVAIERADDGSGSAAFDDDVLISTDQGVTLTKYLKMTEIGGAAFAPDGRVWIGDDGAPSDSTRPRGLYFASSLDATAAKLPHGDYPVQCLTYQQATDHVYVCNPRAWSFGTADTTDGTFAPLLDFRSAPGFYSCDGVDMAKTCEPQLCIAYCGAGHYAQAPLCCAYDQPTCGPAIAESGAAHCPGMDAGTAGAKDAGTHVSPVTAAPAKSSSGCSAAPSSSSTGAASTLSLLAAALFARRRRR